MTHGDSLTLTIEATQRSLADRLEGAVTRHAPRDGCAAMDTFMAATSRHLAAVESTLVPAVRDAAPDGPQVVRDYLQAARRLEHTLAVVKARLYGDVQAAHLHWAELWQRVRADLDAHDRLEGVLADALVRYGEPADVAAMARRLFEAERRAPTRPHPHLPHTGPSGRFVRRVWAVADRFWDAAEGRVIPDPVRPAPHRHDSLVAQYLLGDPHFDDHAALVARRARPRPAPHEDARE